MITPIYIALVALIFLYLSFKTISVRKKFQIAVGDGGNQELLRAMRVHANFSEYVPIALLLILTIELIGANKILVHCLSIILVIGRLAHAYGVSKTKENLLFRQLGMILTFLTLIASIGITFYLSIL